MSQALIKHSVYPLGTLLDNIALNGSATVRTFALGPDIGSAQLFDYATLVLRCAFTYSATGTLTMTVTTGDTAATATAKIMSPTISSGAVTLKSAGTYATESLTNSLEYSFNVDISGLKAISCVIVHGGSSTANDLFTCDGYLTTVPITYNR